jgi:hypothetical protein
MDRKMEIGLRIGGVLLLSILLLGYLGFIPFLSDLLGVKNQPNLNVKFSRADLDSALSKLGLTIDNTRPGESKSIILLDPQPVKTSLNSAELTALINNIADNWKDSPVKNMQIQINNDGTVEVSGTILADRFDGFADAVQMPVSARDKVIPILSLVKSDPSFYAKFSLAVSNGAVTSSFKNIRIGKSSLPVDNIGVIQTSLTNLITQISKSTTNPVKNLSFENGLMIFDGSFPTKILLTPP